MLNMLKRVTRRVLFGKRKNYRTNSDYVTWHAHNRAVNDIRDTLDNLLAKLKYRKIANSNLIGDAKDAKRFNGQWR